MSLSISIFVKFSNELAFHIPVTYITKSIVIHVKDWNMDPNSIREAT